MLRERGRGRWRDGVALFGASIGGGGGNEAPPGIIFNLPFADLGAGAVDTTPTFAGGSPTPTFTRATTAYTVLSSGLLAEVASGVARSCYSADGLTYLGYLAEGARTNYSLWNRDLTNAAWVSGGGGVATAKTATGPDGVANSATTLTASGANGTLLQSITRGSAQRVTGCYIKRRTGSGTVNMTQDNGGTWTAVTVTAGWTAVTIPAATAANPIIGFRLVTSGDAIDVDMVMHEEAAFVSSPIPTTTVAVARNADVLSYVTAGNLSNTAGSYYSEVTGNAAVTTAWFVGDGGAAVYLVSGTLSLFDGAANRGSQAMTLSATPQKNAFAWGGTASVSALSGTASAALDFDGNVGFGASFGVAGQAGSSTLFGTLRNLRIYGTALSAAQLAAMTA